MDTGSHCMGKTQLVEKLIKGRTKKREVCDQRMPHGGGHTGPALHVGSTPVGKHLEELGKWEVALFALHFTPRRGLFVGLSQLQKNIIVNGWFSISGWQFLFYIAHLCHLNLINQFRSNFKAYYTWISRNIPRSMRIMFWVYVRVDPRSHLLNSYLRVVRLHERKVWGYILLVHYMWPLTSSIHTYVLSYCKRGFIVWG